MRYTFAPDVRRWSNGRVLVGGSPLRLLRLSAAGRDAVDRLGSGATVDRASTAAEAGLARKLVRSGILEPRPADGEGPWGPDDVTVVVPVRDRTARLAEALEALTAGPGAPARVVVVDDGSVDPDEVSRVAAVTSADVVRCDRSGGPAAARNRGLAEVTTPLVAFVDSDVTVGSDWLVGTLRFFAEPEVVLVAPRVASRTGADAGALARYESERSPLDLGARSGPVVARSRLAYVPAAAMVCRVDAIAAVGGFDESMTVGEDVDLCWRLADAGSLVWYAGGAVAVTHDDRDERAGWAAWARRRFDYGTSAAPLDRRHAGAVAPLGVSGWSLAAWAAAAAGQPVVGAAVVVGTAAALVRKLDLPEDRLAVASLAVRGNLGAGELVARALVRPWWPLTATAAVVSRRARRLALVAAVVPPLLEWARRRPPLDPAQWTVLSLADDLAYSAGVWVGVWRERSLGAVRPDVHEWPGRSSTADPSGPP